MEKIKIYGLVDPTDGLVKYIGKTNDLIYRLKNHIKNSLKEKSSLTKKEAWIKSLHNKNLKPEIIEIDEVLNDEWFFWEKHYISLYKSWGFELKNMTEGGDGWGKGNVPWNKGIPHSDEFKSLLSNLKSGELNNRYGVKLTDETIEKIQSKRRLKMDEISKKISETKKGVEFTDEHKKSLKESWVVRKERGGVPWNKGKTGYTTKKKGNTIISDDMKKRISEKLTKHKIIQKDLDGNFIKEWLKMELKSEGFSVSYITNVCLGNRNKAYGFKWEYKK